MAEGLIPFVYRAIKRRKSMRRYHSLSPSSTAAAGAAAAAIVAAGRIPEDKAVTDFGGGYQQGYQYRDSHYRHQPQRMSADGVWAPSTLELGGGGNQQQNNHRRWATVDDYALEEYRRQQQQPPLTKARSSRVFSCITGM